VGKKNYMEKKERIIFENDASFEVSGVNLFKRIFENYFKKKRKRKLDRVSDSSVFCILITNPSFPHYIILPLLLSPLASLFYFLLRSNEISNSSAKYDCKLDNISKYISELNSGID
jgi:abortive infection bacteriophage resistance protein